MVGGANTVVNVEGAAEALETDPSAHVSADRNLLLKIPAMDPGAGLVRPGDCLLDGWSRD
jgi:hypothetical protein